MGAKQRSFLATPQGLERLQEAKNQLNLSFTAIAAQAGVSIGTVSRLFHPERDQYVSRPSIEAIVKALEFATEESVFEDWFSEAHHTPLEEAKRRIQIVLREGKNVLDLSGLCLKQLPRTIGELVDLTHLYLSRNELTSLPEEIGQLRSLTQLSLSRNKLTSLPKEIGQLRSLTQLSLSRNKLTSLPKEIGSLSSLKRLYLSRNRIKILPKEIRFLLNLKELSLHRNYIDSLPEEIGSLINLEELYLTRNRLRTIPKEIGGLFKLNRLYLDQNRIDILPAELCSLSMLKGLFLNQNQLQTIPKEISNLKDLKELNLAENQINCLPHEIGSLSNLEILYLGCNKLQKIPQTLGKLKNLEALYLYKNRLDYLPKELVKLKKITSLYLHGNKRLGLSCEILGPSWEEVYEGDLPVNPQDILDYYYRIQDSQQPLNEAKLILVGFGSVGKTSLVNRLIHNEFDPVSQKTDGIQITQWPIQINRTEDIKLHVWDFGGQEIMHSTHQFFLTERSLYLLVLNGRQGHEDADGEYWLELIQSFGGDSPVIVVLNKVKEQPFDVNRRALQQKFPAICEFIQTDCESGIGLTELRTAIERETDCLEHLRVPFPASWGAIKNRLSRMSEDYISFEKYRELCKEDGEAEKNSQDFLAVHLHSLGIALNYKEDNRLRDTHVLNPRWVTNGIYKLLNAHELAETNGELEISCLNRLLDPKHYPSERHDFLLGLMRKFELCFPFQDDDERYLIPDLLDKQQPEVAEDFELTDCLNFRYNYAILPEGLLPRFIVRTHVLSEHQLRWRTGVILNFEGNCALVKADPQDRCITISVDGPTASRRRLLTVIRTNFEHIHSHFKTKPQEKVPVPKHPFISVSYKELCIREEAGHLTFDIFTGDSLLPLNVKDLLDGIDLDHNRLSSSAPKQQDQALRLFYSYAHKDENLRDELEIYLQLLRRQGLIQMWHDRCIIAGKDWAKEIDDNLNRADIILLLISADFIASDYCYDVELKQAMAQHKAGKARVIPIILRPTDWEKTPFGKLQAFPVNAKPVTSWADRDEAWLNVETAIKKAIEDIKAKRDR